MPYRAIAGFFAVGFLGVMCAGLLIHVLTGMPYTSAGVGLAFILAVIAGGFTVTIGSVATIAKVRTVEHGRRRSFAQRGYDTLHDYIHVKWGDRLSNPDDLTIQPLIQVLCDPTFTILKRMASAPVWSIETQRHTQSKLIAHELGLGFTSVGKLAEVDGMFLISNNLAKMLNADDFDETEVLKKIAQMVQETRILANALHRKPTPKA